MFTDFKSSIVSEATDVKIEANDAFFSNDVENASIVDDEIFVDVTDRANVIFLRIRSRLEDENDDDVENEKPLDSLIEIRISIEESMFFDLVCFEIFDTFMRWLTSYCSIKFIDLSSADIDFH